MSDSLPYTQTCRLCGKYRKLMEGRTENQNLYVYWCSYCDVPQKTKKGRRVPNNNPPAQG